MKNLTILLSLLVSLCGCSKMQEKKTNEETKTPTQQSQNSAGKDNSQMENKSSGQTDEKANELSKSADDAIAKYTADKSEETKEEVVSKSLAAGNYLMFEAALPAKEKYRPALKYYRKVLEIDPKNEEAMKNKNQIEEIYIQMGLPIPQ